MDERPPPAPEPPTVAAPGPPTDTMVVEPKPIRPSPITAGWPAAILWAVMAFVVVAALSLLVLVIPYLGTHPRPSLADIARIAGVLFYAFHHVGFLIGVPRDILGAASGL